MVATVIRNARWIVAWEGARHVYKENGDVAFEGNAIVQVGGRYAGTPAREIDGKALMVMPGLVNIHAHPYNQSAYKGIREELSNPHLWGSALYDFTTLFKLDAEGRKASSQYAYGELLRSGVTTVVDLGYVTEGWLDWLAASGLRGVAAPMYSSASWRVKDGHTVEFVWAKDEGRAAFEAAMKCLDAAEAHPSGRLSALVAPAEIDTCTPELLKASAEAARRAKRPMQIHTSESVVQFNQITSRHDKTPVQWAEGLGILGPATSLGHGLFLDHHDWLHWPTRRDLDVLAATGTSVAHAPTVFSRYGQTLQSFAAYRAKGINLGIGTDTFPHNMLEEMRTATILGRVSARRAYDTRLADVFHAATVGGANILGRMDIGRLTVGAKADLVLVSLDHVAMRPLRDPLRSLVFTAAERAVRDVFVDGRAVVEGGRVLTIDMDEVSARLEAAQARAEANVPTLDAKKRTALEAVPLALPRG